MGVGLVAVLTAVLAVAALALAGAVAVLEHKSAPVPHLTAASALACAALLALAGSSLMQLGRPQLIFAAFSNPSSSIFRLGAAWVLAVIFSAAYLSAVHRAAFESTCRRLALASAGACALVLAAHASSYVMAWRAAWNTWSIVLPFFGFAALAATAAKGVIDSLEGHDFPRRQALAAAAFAVLAMALYLGVIGAAATPESTAARALTGDLAGLFWGAVIGVGLLVPSVLMLVVRRGALMFAAAFAAVLAGSAGWQILVLKLGSAAWSFFAR